MVRILEQKNCLNIFYESLNLFFSLETKFWIFVKDLIGRNLESCSNLTCYA